MKTRITLLLAAVVAVSAGCGGRQRLPDQPKEKATVESQGHYEMGEYQDVEFTPDPPVARLGGAVLPAASVDWEAVNGVPAQTKPASLAWPAPRSLDGPAELRLDIPAQPLEVYIRQFTSVGEKGFPTVQPTSWNCSRLRDPGCGFRREGGSQVMTLPDELFTTGGPWYTIQVFWDVPWPKRHPDYPDRASSTVVWLFTRDG